MRALPPFLGILLQAGHDDPLQRGRNLNVELRERRGVAAEDRRHDARACGAVERAMAGDRFVEQQAKSEDVTARIVAASPIAM